MGDIFYRGIDPSGMCYSDLRYYSRWHNLISKTEADAVAAVRSG